MIIKIEPYKPTPGVDSDLSTSRWSWSVHDGSVFSGVEESQADAWKAANAIIGRISHLLPFYGANDLQQRALAAEAALAAALARETAGIARERERVLTLVRAAYASARERERRCDVVDPSAASDALDVLEQHIERGEHLREEEL